MIGDGDIDQDDLAAEWGAEEPGEDAGTVSDDAGDQDALAAAWGAETGAGDQDDLAAAWGAEMGMEDGEGGEADAAAAEWAAMVDPGGAAGPEESDGVERVLDQDEIDSLLGYDLDVKALEDSTGIRAIINSGVVSYERLPMLEIVFDRLVRLLTSSLRNFTSDNVEVSLDLISTTRFGDYLNSIPLPAMLAVFKAVEWDNFGLITVDSNLIYAIVDVLLGGRGSAAIRVEGRPYTTIESALVKSMIEMVLADAEKAFEPLSAVTFDLERLETNPRFAAIAREANAAIRIQLRIDMEDRGGNIEVLLPYSTLEPIRDLLLQGFMGEKFGRDSIWEGHLATDIWSTTISLDAVLDELSIPLRQAMNLKVGDTITLNAEPSSPVIIRCGNIPLTTGRMGRKGENIAVRVCQGIQNRNSGQAELADGG